MKILQINRYHHIRGGSETVYFNTAEILKRNGHDVHFFAMDYPENEQSADSKFFTPVVELPLMSIVKKIRQFSKYFYNRRAAKDIERLVKEIKPDLAHLHIFYGCLTSSILSKLKKLKVPIVITAHDYRLVCPAGNFFDGDNKICIQCEGHSFYNCFIKKCAKQSYITSLFFSIEAYFRNWFYPPQSLIDKFIFVSDFSLEMNVKYKKSIASKSTRIHNFLPITKKNEEVKKGSYFLYMGRLIEEKGLRTLVDAFNLRQDHKLKISGTGPLLEELLLRKNSNVEFIGFNSGKILADLVINCSCVIVPSEWFETFGMVIVEAFSYGKPVIASNIGGIPELISHGNNGFLFEPFSIDDLVAKIDLLASTTELEYKSLSKNALLSANKFSSEKHYTELMAVYNSAIN